MQTVPRAKWPTRPMPGHSAPPINCSAADQYSPLIVAYNNGAAVRLSDIADVTDSVEDVRNAGMVDGTPSVMIIIFRHPEPISSTRWTG